MPLLLLDYYYYYYYYLLRLVASSYYHCSLCCLDIYDALRKLKLMYKVYMHTCMAAACCLAMIIISISNNQVTKNR